ncbi:MAG: hypothetical protein ACW99U_18655 [Candidatus Thorarchaeota archaeon]
MIGLQPYQTELSLQAPFWSIGFREGMWYFYLRPNFFFDFFSVIVLLPRVAFVVAIIRLYSGKTTMKRAISIGVISEMPLMLLMVVGSSMVLFDPYWPYLIIGIPTPVLLFIAYLIIRFRPPIKDVVEWLESSQDGA